MKLQLLIFLLGLILHTSTYSQKVISGCFKFRLIEFTTNGSNSISDTTRELMECIYDKMICFDSAVVVTIPFFSTPEAEFRILEDRRSNLRYDFKTTPSGKFVMIDSSYFGKQKLIKKTKFERTDINKNILGFECTKYVLVDGNVKHEKFVAEFLSKDQNDSSQVSDIFLVDLESSVLYPGSNSWKTVESAVQFIQPEDASIYSSDISGYTVLTYPKWKEIGIGIENPSVTHPEQDACEQLLDLYNCLSPVASDANLTAWYLWFDSINYNK